MIANCTFHNFILFLKGIRMILALVDLELYSKNVVDTSFETSRSYILDTR